MCKRKRLLYDKKFIRKVESSINNSQVFWREIGNVLNKPKSKAPISLDVWFEHFNSLFANNSTTNHVCNVGCENASISDSFNEIEDIIFNAEISNDEILKSTKELKLNKASGGSLIAQQLVYDIDV